MIAYPLKTKSSTQQYINPQNSAKNCTKKTQTFMSTVYACTVSPQTVYAYTVGLDKSGWSSISECCRSDLFTPCRVSCTPHQGQAITMMKWYSALLPTNNGNTLTLN